MCSDGRMHFAACAQHGQHSTIGARIWIRHVCFSFVQHLQLANRQTRVCHRAYANCIMQNADCKANAKLSVGTVFVRCNIMTMIDATIHSKAHDTHTRIGHGIVTLVRLPRPRPLWQNCAEQSSIHVELPVVCPEHAMPDESCTNELKIALNRYRSLSQY